MNRFMIQDLTPASLLIYQVSTIMRITKITGLLFVILFTPVVYASEPAQPEVTIDSPPEVIAEDFLRVAAVPPSWFYLLYNWVGTFDIDPNNVTEKDLEKYVADTDKREKIKQAIDIIKQFDTYPGDYRIAKWETMPINISLTYEPEMDEAIRQTIELIEKNTNIRFKIHEERITENGITVDTYGLKKEHTDYYVCEYDYACGDRLIYGSTTYFKGDGGYTLLEQVMLDFFLRTLDLNQKRFDKVNYFTPNTRFTKRFQHDFHVNGAIANNKNFTARFSACDIFNNHENKEISKSLASECVFRALGLTQFTADREALLSQRSTDFENIHWMTNPSEYDLLLLKILYDKRLKSGMSKDEARPIVIQILEEIMTGEE